MMRIIEGHKGCYEYTTEFRGLEGHGSEPERGVNAVHYAVRYVSRLLELGEALKARAPEGSRFRPPWTTLQVGRIEGGAARNVIAGHCAVAAGVLLPALASRAEAMAPSRIEGEDGFAHPIAPG